MAHTVQVLVCRRPGIARGATIAGLRSATPKETALTTPYQHLITIEPGKRGGKPCIRGLRITVYDVLSYLAAGMSVDEILADFPDLTRDDILACLTFAAERERQLLVAA